MLQLRAATPPAWVDTVMADFDAFLLDHAACERKASAMGMTFVVRYPDRQFLLDPMIAFAREELEHFHQVFRLIAGRGLSLGADTPDPYVNALVGEVRHGRDERLLDRLVMAGVVEARGCERFGLIARALTDPELRDFYRAIETSESRHHGLFLRLARQAFDADRVGERLDAFLDKEAQVIADLPLRPALH